MRSTVCVLSLITGASICLAQAPTAPPSNAYATKNNLATGSQDYSVVHVYIGGNVSLMAALASSAIKQGFANDSATYADRGILYTFTTVMSPPALGTNDTYVTTGMFSNPSQYGNNAFNYAFDGTTGLNHTLNSIITLSPSIVNSTNALTYATAHEESHNNLLGDCPTCVGTSTIMTYQNDVFNPPFLGPTGIDSDAEANYGFFGGAHGGGPECSEGFCPDPN